MFDKIFKTSIIILLFYLLFTLNQYKNIFARNMADVFLNENGRFSFHEIESRINSTISILDTKQGTLYIFDKNDGNWTIASQNFRNIKN